MVAMSRGRRLIIWFFGTILLLYGGICSFLLIEQNALLYIGTTLPPHPPGLDLAAWSGSDGAQLGWLVSSNAPRGTIVFFHGNDEEAWQAAQKYGPYFAARGWRVLFPEYPGFDFRTGLAPTHDHVIAGAVAAMRLAAQDFPGKPLWVAGNSLGAGIAAQATGPGDAARVLLFVPWDVMSAVAAERYPFVPTVLLLALDGTDYDSCAALARLGAATFIIYAGQDQIIPPHHAQHLAACLNLPQAHILALPQAGHLDWSSQLSPAQWDYLLAAP